MSKDNIIRCRFCSWETTKWGKRSKPSQAFIRLYEHIEDKHSNDPVAKKLLASVFGDEEKK